MSAHHKSSGRSSIGRRTWEAAQECPELWRSFQAAGDEHYAAQPPTQLRLAGGGFSDELREWQAIQDQIHAASVAGRQWSATSLAESQLEPSAQAVPASPIDLRERVDLDDDGSGKRSASWRANGGGAALGSAVHAALELVDFANPGDLTALAGSCATNHGISELAGEVESRLRSALDSPTIALARAATHWRELYVAIPTGSGTVEGFIDLCIETDDGLVVVDYKTDELVGPTSVADKVDRYRIQGATYAVALERVTGLAVVECRFLFVGPDGVVEASLDDLDAATAQVRQLLAISDVS